MFEFRLICLFLMDYVESSTDSAVNFEENMALGFVCTSSNLLAARQIVPQVSAMSSTRIATRSWVFICQLFWQILLKGLLRHFMVLSIKDWHFTLWMCAIIKIWMNSEEQIQRIPRTLHVGLYSSTCLKFHTVCRNYHQRSIIYTSSF